jgi:hypothetical protein
VTGMKKFLFAVAAVAAVMVLAVFLFPPPSAHRAPASPAAVPDESSAGEPLEPPDAGHEDQRSAAGFSRALTRVLAELRDGTAGAATDARRAELFHEMKRAALAAEPSSAADAIVAALDAGDDAGTGLGFVVGAGGAMTETPTYRTALLDVLGQVDPRAAALHARRLLRDPSVSPDEYAIALRNLAHGPREEFTVAEIRTAFAAMVARQDWRADPTTGFLEAFDAAVEASAFAEIAPLLVDPGEAAETPLVRAAFIAADRIMLSDPGAVVSALAADPRILSSAPFHRASLLSRLDVRDPSQQALLKEYLLRFEHAPDELDYFFDVFPNGNAFVGYSLVTRGAVGGPDEAAVSRFDEVTVGTLRNWLSLPEFSARSEGLGGVIRRLTGSGPTDP